MTGPLELVRGVLQGNHVRWVLSSSFTFSDGTTSQVDVLLNVTQEFEQERPGNVTDRPVEDADSITDHVRLDPIRISFTAYLTPDTSGITLATVLKTDVDERAEILESWRDNLAILTLTGKRVIENLVIESMTERQQGLRDSRVFSITLREVKIADTDAVSEAGVGTREQQTEETPV